MVKKYKLYAVMNSDDKFLRAKGYGGTGECWIDGVKTARIYTHQSPAKAQVTYWKNHYPEYETPKLVELIISEINIIDQKDRAEKAIKAIKKRKTNHKKRILENEIKLAQEELREFIEKSNMEG